MAQHDGMLHILNKMNSHLPEPQINPITLISEPKFYSKGQTCGLNNHSNSQTPLNHSSDKTTNMQILITNDDGISSKGIIALANKFKEMGDVLVVAPNKQMSATSHSITTNKPLRYKKHYINNELFGYALEGTPADCVKFAILELLKKQKPDIILSGINHGRNTGINIMYSGTIAGATEGALLNIPSFAVSLSSHDTQADCSAAAELAFQIVSKTMSECIATANIPNTSSLYDEMADLPSNIKQDYQTLPVLNGKEKQNSNTTDSTSYPSKENAQGVSAAVSDTSCIKQEDRPRLFENNVFININVPDVETNKIKGVKVVKSSNSY